MKRRFGISAPFFLNDDLDKSPYEPLVIPPFQPLTKGPWKLRNQIQPQLLSGYFTRPQLVSENWVLTHENIKAKRPSTVWMSITPMERESLSVSLAHATGDVVVYGLGLGLLLYNLALKPEVTSITVIEQNSSVLELYNYLQPFHETYGSPDKPIEIIQGVANKFKSSTLKPDSILIDIWPYLHDRNLPRDTQAILRQWPGFSGNYHSWGQELAFINFCSKFELEADGPYATYLAKYNEWMGHEFKTPNDTIYYIHSLQATMMSVRSELIKASKHENK